MVDNQKTQPAPTVVSSLARNTREDNGRVACRKTSERLDALPLEQSRALAPWRQLVGWQPCQEPTSMAPTSNSGRAYYAAVKTSRYLTLRLDLPHLLQSLEDTKTAQPYFTIL